jgi:acetyl-CoA/propionyl-CoA carboxylase biotin carboxyl carrier protein
VQVLADAHGNVVHLGERDCSIQRRHQKLIEESPAPLVDASCASGSARSPSTPARPSTTAARARSRACSEEGEYFFLEMNTRVQVEHCVTEAVTGRRHRARADPDRRRRAALPSAGRHPLARARDRVPHQRRGRAKNFAPAPGTVTHYREPSGPGVRVDSGVLAGSEITPLYDPMVAKLIVWDADREKRHAADGAGAEGVRDRGRQDPDPVPQGDHGLRAVGQRRDLPRPHRGQAVAEALAFPKASQPGEDEPSRRARLHRRGLRQALRRDACTASVAAPTARRHGAARPRPKRERKSGGGGGGGDTLASPLQGNVFKVLVEQGAEVEEGALDLHHRGDEDGERDHAHKAGKIAELPISEGRAVTAGDTLARHQWRYELDALIDEAATGCASRRSRRARATRRAARGRGVGARRVLEAGGTCELVATPGGALWSSASCGRPR